jgi:hypothetical protein
MLVSHVTSSESYGVESFVVLYNTLGNCWGPTLLCTICCNLDIEW